MSDDIVDFNQWGSHVIQYAADSRGCPGLSCALAAGLVAASRAAHDDLLSGAAGGGRGRAALRPLRPHGRTRAAPQSAVC